MRIFRYWLLLGLLYICWVSDAQVISGPPIPLNANATTDTGSDVLPAIASDRAGHRVAVWSSNNTLGGSIGSDYDILVARSSDKGSTWTPPAPLNTNADGDSDDDLSPVLATDDNGHWVVAWYTGEGILTASSIDNGQTWSVPVLVSDTGSVPSLTTDSKGTWLLVWEQLDTVNDLFQVDDDIMQSRSTDNGATWSVPVPVNNYAATDSGGGVDAPVDDRRPNLCTDGRGTWLAAWEWHVGFYDADLLVAISHDNGATWTDPFWLNINAMTDSGSDANPCLATDRQGNWIATWDSNQKYRTQKGAPRRDFNVLVARSKDNGNNWTLPRPLNNNAGTDKGNDWSPTVTTDRKGNWVAAWESNESFGGSIGRDFDILFARSTNCGRDWSDPAPLNANASSDAGKDAAVALACDENGHWIAAWQSRDTLADTIGTDFDILSRAFALAPLPLNVRVPNDGEAWRAGSRYEIKWDFTSAAGPHVKIELLLNGDVVSVIKASTANDGSYDWTLDAALASRKGYRIRITSTQDPSIKDTTDGQFRITPGKEVPRSHEEHEETRRN